MFSDSEQRVVNVAAWGYAPTPLLPAAMRQAHIGGSILKLRDLQFTSQELDASFWRKLRVLPTDVTESALLQLRQHGKRVVKSVATARIAPSSLAHCPIALKSLPLRTRTHNTLAAQKLATVGQIARLTYADVARFPQFGMTSVLDLTCCLEALADELMSAQSTGLTSGSKSLTELVDELLLVFSQRELMVLRTRVFPPAVTATLEELGQRAGVTRERIRQIENKVQRKLAGRLHQPAFESLRRHADMLHEALGSAVPANSLESTISEMLPTSPVEEVGRAVATEVMLWLAGPYELRDGWLVKDRAVWETSASALSRAVSDGALLRASDAGTALAVLGIVERYHSSWIDELGGFRKVDQGWVVFRGSLVMKCLNWIRYRQEPVLVSELALITETESERSLRNRLLEDRRLKRITKQGHIALRDWEQYDEYTGVAEEIAQELERQGGAASLEHLVSVLSARYGVRPNSVRQYASAPMFIRAQDGKVRLRPTDQRLTVSADPADSAGCYFVEGAWALRFEVTLDTLRGSGRPVPLGFAVAVGCQPGQRISFCSEYGDILLSWPETAASGPTLGSVRAHAEMAGASEGDFLFVGQWDGGAVIRLLSRSTLQHSVRPLERLWLLVGLDPLSLPLAGNVWEEIGAAIGLGEDAENASPDDVKRALSARGEPELAELIPANPQSETGDTALRRIAGLLR